MLEKVTYVIQRVWTYLSRFPFRSRGSLFLMHSIIRALIPREDMVMERRRLAPSGNYILYGSSAFAPVRVRPWLLAGRGRGWGGPGGRGPAGGSIFWFFLPSRGRAGRSPIPAP